MFSHGSESLNIITKGNYLKKDYFDNYKKLKIYEKNIYNW